MAASDVDRANILRRHSAQAALALLMACVLTACSPVEGTRADPAEPTVSVLEAIQTSGEFGLPVWPEILGVESDSGADIRYRMAGRANLGTLFLAFMARHFGSVFVLALVQRFEARASYDDDADATPTMAADEQIHEEVIRALAARGRDRLSGSFRAAVFGANDGLVSNLALIIGVAASGVDNHTVLVTGLAGLLAGALSMGAGEYVSVSSQRELLEASAPSPNVGSALTQLDVDANELELVYRARGMSPEEASAHASKVLRDPVAGAGTHASADGRQHDAIGTGLGAAISSFLFFATGAIIPVLPYLFGLSGTTAIVVAAVLVGLALLGTGVIVGLLSGAPPMRRAMRQLLIGYGAAAVTYLLGLLVGGGVG